jgi:hypothetical protein
MVILVGVVDDFHLVEDDWETPDAKVMRRPHSRGGGGRRPRQAGSGGRPSLDGRRYTFGFALDVEVSGRRRRAMRLRVRREREHR